MLYTCTYGIYTRKFAAPQSDTSTCHVAESFITDLLRDEKVCLKDGDVADILVTYVTDNFEFKTTVPVTIKRVFVGECYKTYFDWERV